MELKYSTVSMRILEKLYPRHIIITLPHHFIYHNLLLMNWSIPKNARGHGANAPSQQCRIDVTVLPLHCPIKYHTYITETIPNRTIPESDKCHYTPPVEGCNYSIARSSPLIAFFDLTRSKKVILRLSSLVFVLFDSIWILNSIVDSLFRLINPNS